MTKILAEGGTTTTAVENTSGPRSLLAEPEVPPRELPVRKPIVKPELKRQGLLPKVTGSFIGSFSP